MAVQPPRIEESVQRSTEGRTPNGFCAEVMNVLYGSIWEICEIMEDKNAVLFQNLVPLQESLLAQDINNIGIGTAESKMGNSCSILRALKQGLDSKLKLALQLQSSEILSHRLTKTTALMPTPLMALALPWPRLTVKKTKPLDLYANEYFPTGLSSSRPVAL
jgi:hypothetical protein